MNIATTLPKYVHEVVQILSSSFTDSAFMSLDFVRYLIHNSSGFLTNPIVQYLWRLSFDEAIPGHASKRSWLEVTGSVEP